MNQTKNRRGILLSLALGTLLFALACGQVVVQEAGNAGESNSGGDIQLPESSEIDTIDIEEILQDPEFGSEASSGEITFDEPTQEAYEDSSQEVVPAYAGEEFTNEFESADSWETINDGAVFGQVLEGTFGYGIDQSDSYGWTVAGTLGYGSGVFEVETTQSSGPEDAGYGLILRESGTDFYLFTISTDGLAWIGYCEEGCDTADTLVGDGWFATDAINTGVGATNHLIVEAEGGNLAFFINDSLIGETFDTRLGVGDIGMYVESGEIGVNDDLVLVQFDNLYFTPFE